MVETEMLDNIHWYSLWTRLFIIHDLYNFFVLNSQVIYLVSSTPDSTIPDKNKSKPWPI